MTNKTPEQIAEGLSPATAEIVGMVQDARQRLGSVPGYMLDMAVARGVMRRIAWNRWTWTEAVAAVLARKVGA